MWRYKTKMNRVLQNIEWCVAVIVWWWYEILMLRVGLSSFSDVLSPARSCQYWIYVNHCGRCVCAAQYVHDICRNGEKTRQFSSLYKYHTLAKCKSLAVNVKYTQRINFVHNGPNRIGDKGAHTFTKYIYFK